MVFEPLQPSGTKAFSVPLNALVALHTLPSGEVWVVRQHPDGTWFTLRKATDDDRAMFARIALDASEARLLATTGTASEEEAIGLTHLPQLRLTRTGHGYKVENRANHKQWAFGKSIAEAVGDYLITHGVPVATTIGETVAVAETASTFPVMSFQERRLMRERATLVSHLRDTTCYVPAADILSLLNTVDHLETEVALLRPYAECCQKEDTGVHS